MKKVLIFMVSLLSLCALFGCKEKEIPLDTEHGISDQSKLFGVCYLMEERDLNYIDVEKEALLMNNLGVKSVRHWIHFSHFLSDSKHVKTQSKQLPFMHQMLAECSKYGIMNIGMNHHNFRSPEAKGTTTSKPFKRDISEGSEYVLWLETYYDSWFTLATEFSEVMYWEVDNEVNNPDFMNSSSNQYTVYEMCDIATDMFYYASRAIHDANPNAKVVMGSLTEPSGLGTGNSLNFLKRLYKNINSGNFGYFYNKEDKENASKNADDYFEIACWHPYMSNFDKQRFIDLNNEFYQVILDNEGKHKKVFFTEYGWNDAKIGGEDDSILRLQQFAEAVKEMPYVETTNIFKLYDNGTKNNWDGPDFLYYGLVHDPNPTHVYTKCNSTTNPLNVTEDGVCITGAPKNKAYEFQKIAGGNGDLTILMDDAS